MDEEPEIFKTAKESIPNNIGKRKQTLSLGLGIFAVVFLFVAGIIFFVFYIIKQSNAYQAALIQVKNNPQAIEMLGEPIEEGWYVTGNINVSGPSGSANMTFPVIGPKGKGTVYLDAVKHMGQWKFRELVVTVDGTDRSIPIIPPETWEESRPED